MCKGGSPARLTRLSARLFLHSQDFSRDRAGAPVSGIDAAKNGSAHAVKIFSFLK
jgi:hypothetical protein